MVEVMSHPGHALACPDGDGAFPRAPGVTTPFACTTTESLLEVPGRAPQTRPTANFGQLGTSSNVYPCPCSNGCIPAVNTD
jgi:hypothetical protein